MSAKHTTATATPTNLYVTVNPVVVWFSATTVIWLHFMLKLVKRMEQWMRELAEEKESNRLHLEQLLLRKDEDVELPGECKQVR